VDIEGGKLGGTGTINGDVLMKGTLSPGSNGMPGAPTINGNYEQGGTGVFDEFSLSTQDRCLRLGFAAKKEKESSGLN
jgi:hypothetical protein